MRKTRLALMLLLACVLVVALAGCGSGATSAPSSGSGSATPSSGGGKTTEVTIKGFAFSPSSVDVAVGDTVNFTNQDSVTHTVTGDGWDSGPLATGKSFSKKFDTAGTFNYKCSIHPTMTGVINVK